MSTLLIVSPEASERRALAQALAKHPQRVVANGAEALLAVQSAELSALICSLELPGLEGEQLVRHLLAKQPDLAVLVVTDPATEGNALDLVEAGAAGWIRRPLDPRSVRYQVERALELARLRRESIAWETRQTRKSDGRTRLVGESAPMDRLKELVRRVGPTPLSVLITGESGTGKEVVARSLHEASDRAGGPFVPVDCAAIPANLMESELFGHEKGAFTGASGRRVGLVEASDKGTFFLDEIGELDLSTQVKLLRLLQERQFRRVGGNRIQSVDLRLVAATNRDLEAMVAQGTFREDLFHRLNVVRMHLPPLRERPEDVPLLLQHFLERYTAEAGRPPLELPARVVDSLCAYAWPGNVRELVNAARFVASLAPGPQVRIEDLPPRVRGSLRSGLHQAPPHRSRPGAGATVGVRYDLPFKAAKKAWVEVFEVAYITQLLQHHQGNVSRAAESAGIDRKSIQRMMKRHGLRKD